MSNTKVQSVPLEYFLHLDENKNTFSPSDTHPYTDDKSLVLRKFTKMISCTKNYILYSKYILYFISSQYMYYCINLSLNIEELNM